VQPAARMSRRLLWLMIFLLPGVTLARTSDESAATRDTVESSPPYIKLKRSDLRIEQLSGDITLVSFHLVQEKSVGRQTLIFKHFSDGWKAVHAHASNIATP